MNFKIYTIIAALVLPMAASAQNTERKLCDFESADAYRSIHVYDTWENSPFRNNSVEGNIQLVQNHLNDADPVRGFAPNPSRHILAVQRSRFGSNTFGALVGLKEPFAQTKTVQYVHVKIYSPKGGPAMLIGLGNRDDRPHQSPLTEQFWATASQPLVANHWNDAVFAVSGANGVTIHNLLIVPDATSPHNLTADFAAYIDDIVLSADEKPFFTVGVSATARVFKHGDPEPLSVKAVPAPGFRFNKLVIRHGRNIDGNAQGDWTETVVTADRFNNGTYTIPANVIDGDLRFVPYFSSVAAEVK